MEFLELPFVEGTPSREKVREMREWISRHSNRYDQKNYVALYHGTAASLSIMNEGLLPTTRVTRRRSYQSTPGYVYLASTPERAEQFGALGNGGEARILVYRVCVPVWKLRPDLDQLRNQRSVGVQVGGSLAESIVYGGGARVRGAVEPWALAVVPGFGILRGQGSGVGTYLPAGSPRKRTNKSPAVSAAGLSLNLLPAPPERSSAANNSL